MAEADSKWTPERTFVVVQKTLGVWFLASGIIEIWGRIWVAALTNSTAKVSVFGELATKIDMGNPFAASIVAPLGSIAVGWWLAARPLSRTDSPTEVVPVAPWETASSDAAPKT